MARTMNIKVTCGYCHQEFNLVVDPKDYNDFVMGKHAQDAFPYLTPGERELLISQTCPACWDEIFKEPEESDPTHEEWPQTEDIEF